MSGENRVRRHVADLGPDQEFVVADFDTAFEIDPGCFGRIFQLEFCAAVARHLPGENLVDGKRAFAGLSVELWSEETKGLVRKLRLRNQEVLISFV